MALRWGEDEGRAGGLPSNVARGFTRPGDPSALISPLHARFAAMHPAILPGVVSAGLRPTGFSYARYAGYCFGWPPTHSLRSGLLSYPLRGLGLRLSSMPHDT